MGRKSHTPEVLLVGDAAIEVEKIHKATEGPTLQALARRTLGLPPEWQWVQWKAEGQHPDYWGMTVSGGVYPSKSRGKNAGKPNFRAGTMLRVFTASNEQISEFERQWEAETGICKDCKNTGWKWAGWSADSGARYRRCPRPHSAKATCEGAA